MQTLFCSSRKFIRVIDVVAAVVVDVADFVVDVDVALLIKHASGPRVIKVSSGETKLIFVCFIKGF